MANFTYVAPTTVNQGLKILNQSEYNIQIAAGCTNIMPSLQGKQLTNALLMDISGLAELKAIQVIDNKIHIGALTTISEIIESEVIKENALGLWQAACNFADPLVRNRATLAGNLADTSPAADGVVPLLAFDATVVVESLEQGRREIPVTEFVVGPRKNALRTDEMILAITFEKDRELKSSFIKFGLRKAMAISLINTCVAIKLKDNAVAESRIAFGAVAPTAIRAKRTESFLSGKELTAEVLDQAVEILHTEISPIDDLRGSREYRLHLSGVLLRRAIEAALA